MAVFDKDQKKHLREAAAALESARQALEDIAQELRSAFDDMSEKQQEGAKGQTVSSTADTLDEWALAVEEMTNNVDGYEGETP